MADIADIIANPLSMLTEVEYNELVPSLKEKYDVMYGTRYHPPNYRKDDVVRGTIDEAYNMDPAE
tara:strand:+ start:727 stop:921 length:195 start_codon:yes stop_codon:yes gene_type:complete